MIFNEYPWLNEPGRESGDKNSLESLTFNETICYMTTQLAIIDWAEGNHAAVWDDVVDYHFRHNGEEILKTVTRWGGTIFVTAMGLDVTLAKYQSKDKTDTLSTSVSPASNGTLTKPGSPVLSQIQEALPTDTIAEPHTG
jgi:hypothetical protein